MDNTVLKKRLNTFKTGTGRLSQVGDDVVMDVLRAWENWQGSTADLYRDLGLSKMQLVTMIQKAKRLVKSGAVIESEFKEVAINSGVLGRDSGSGIEVCLENGRLIRFYEVDKLVEFLKKAG